MDGVAAKEWKYFEHKISAFIFNWRRNEEKLEKQKNNNEFIAKNWYLRVFSSRPKAHLFAATPFLLFDAVAAKKESNFERKLYHYQFGSHLQQIKLKTGKQNNRI